MILIVSKEKLEPSTEKVMQWLNYLGASFYRVNGINMFQTDFFDVKIGADSCQSTTDLAELIDKTNVVWFRRWSDREYVTELYDQNIGISMFDALRDYLSFNMSTLKNYFFYKLNSKFWLSHPNFSADPNKLIVLDKASKMGLRIPKSAVISTKQQLKIFNDVIEGIITKDIDMPFQVHTQENSFASYTSIVDSQFINNLPDTFPPTFFQEKIEKKYELRIFFLDDVFYPMAIFSQSDDQTKVDFRKYNLARPNRNVPYVLPNTLTEKLSKLMKLLRLDNGSIDMIYSSNNEYVFLEVNPVGQFGMTSTPCNYFIEKKIAEYLIKNDKQHVD